MKKIFLLGVSLMVFVIDLIGNEKIILKYTESKHSTPQNQIPINATQSSTVVDILS